MFDQYKLPMRYREPNLIRKAILENLASNFYAPLTYGVIEGKSNEPQGFNSVSAPADNPISKKLCKFHAPFPSRASRSSFAPLSSAVIEKKPAEVQVLSSVSATADEQLVATSDSGNKPVVCTSMDSPASSPMALHASEDTGVALVSPDTSSPEAKRFKPRKGPNNRGRGRGIARGAFGPRYPRGRIDNGANVSAAN